MSKQDGTLPRICVHSSAIEQAQKGWEAIAQGNGQAGKDGHYDIAPRVLLQGQQLVRLDNLGGLGGVFIQPMTLDMLSLEANRAAFWYKIEGKGDDRKEVRSEPHEGRVVRKMAAWERSGIPVPQFDGFVGVPTFGPDGRLHAQVGFNERTQTYFRPKVRIPAVPEDPSPEEVRGAVERLIGTPSEAQPEGGWLWDFKYTYRAADMAHVLAAALQQFVRPLVDGPTPLFLIDKPNAGDGATTLAGAIARIATASPIPPGSTDVGSGGDELRKALTAAFRGDPEVVFFDNIGKALTQDVLAVALTSPRWSDRVLGGSVMLDRPVRCLWLGTGKNPTMTDQIRRRTIRVRLDPLGQKVVGRTFLRPGFDGLISEPGTLGGLVWAGLVLCQNWVRKGMPSGEKRHNSFPAWARVMGGILEAAGVGGFLSLTEDQMHRHLDEEGEAMGVFVKAWWETWQGKGITARMAIQLHEKIDSDLVLDKGLTEVAAMRKVLDRAKGEHYGSFRIERANRMGNTTAWRLSRMEGVDADALNEVLELSSRQEGQEAREDETQGGWEASK